MAWINVRLNEHISRWDFKASFGHNHFCYKNLVDAQFREELTGLN